MVLAFKLLKSLKEEGNTEEIIMVMVWFGFVFHQPGIEAERGLNQEKSSKI